MKKILLLLGVIAMFAMTSCSTEQLIESSANAELKTDEAICGEAKVVDLIAGQHINVGTVSVSNDEENLYVTYETTGDWYLTETHVYVGAEADIPLNGGGNPRIGHFPYSETHDDLKSYTYTISLDGLGECFVVATHAVVNKIENGEVVQGETAFGCGDKEFPGNRWGCYFDYCVEECEEEECFDAFAFKPTGKLTLCFLDDGFSEAGWTQRFTHIWLRDYYNRKGFAYKYPIILEPETCDPSSGLEIGYVEMLPSYDGSDVYMTVSYVITNSDYMMSDVNLYMDRSIYPQDGDGLDTIDRSTYTHSASGINSNEYTFSNLPWPTSLEEDANVFLIPHATICKAEM